MIEDSRNFDPVQTLTRHGEHLNTICSPAWWPKVFYEILSGALIWRDETNRKTPVEVIWALRLIVAYPTSLMLNKPRHELKPMWDLGLSLFPKWVGFRSERRQATPKLLEIYRRGDVCVRKCLRDIEQEMAKRRAEARDAATTMIVVPNDIKAKALGGQQATANLCRR